MPDKQNYEQLIDKLIQSAENGDAKSQYHLGVLYHDGKDVDQNYFQAAYWYRKAAEQGHNKAQLYLGLLYSRGYGVPRNYDEAVKWLTLSSENGNEKANDFLDDILNAQESEESEENENTPSRSLIFTVMASAVILLSVIVIASALLFMDRTNDMIASVSSLPVKTLPNNDDDILSPPVNAAYNPDVFSLAESGTLSQIQNAILRGVTFRETHDDGENPLHRAAASNHDPEIIKLLIAHGLNVNSEWSSGSGFTPLLLAVMNANTSAALELLNHNADPNYIDANSLSVMQNLIITGSEGKINQNDIIRIIIAMVSSGADINYHSSLALSASSCTPLSLAVQYDMPEVADILIESNADVSIRDDSGKTASDYAKELRKNSALRKSPVFAKLTSSSKAQSKTSDRNINSSGVQDKIAGENIMSGRQQAEKLLKAKKISPFVRDTGTFEYNSDYENGNVEITGSNVRMRKQPNTKSRVVKTVSRISANESLKYLGEWTSPQGDKWVVCAYKENQKVRDVDAKIVWIFSEYTRLIRANEKDLVLEGDNIDL